MQLNELFRDGFFVSSIELAIADKLLACLLYTSDAADE
mgnify:CR=1 FL=1